MERRFLWSEERTKGPTVVFKRVLIKAKLYKIALDANYDVGNQDEGVDLVKALVPLL